MITPTLITQGLVESVLVNLGLGEGGVVPQPPTDWEEIDLGGSNIIGGYGAAASSSAILIATSAGIGNGLVSDNGGVSFSHLTDTLSEVTYDCAINEVAGIYLFMTDVGIWTSSSATGPYSKFHTGSYGNVGSVAISDNGSILAIEGNGTAAHWNFFNGSTWDRQFISAHVIWDCCHIGNNKFIATGYEGKAYIIDGGLDAPNITELEYQLNNGGSSSLYKIDCNKHGLCVCTAENGYASYTLTPEVPGSWLPLPRYQGQSVLGPFYIRDVAVTDSGYVLVANRYDGQVSYAHVSDLSNWTLLDPYMGFDPLPDANIALAGNGDKFIASYYYSEGRTLISPPRS